MNPILNLTIGDIMVTDLIYYDKDIKDTCLEFCKKLGISSMPSLDRKSYFSIENGRFREQKLDSEEHYFRTNDLLFDKETIKKFKKDKDNVLFVLNQKNQIIGVVHISDYNNDKMYLHFYQYLMLFEKNLRNFLKSQGYKNDDFINYMKEKLPPNYNSYFPEDDTEKCQKMKEKIQKLGIFEAFLLSDLMVFSNAKEKTKFRDEVKDFRNWIGHFKSAIGFELTQEMQILYDINSLDVFVEQVEAFCDAYEKIELRFLQRTNKEKMIKHYG
ncbi:MAG: hypothetical protein JNL70_18380 [Saprospiraceae bacterium]|nr:hypothetical protein [Saprospiraceae bacterium]